MNTYAIEVITGVVLFGLFLIVLQLIDSMASFFVEFRAQKHMFVGDQRRPSPEVHMEGSGVYQHRRSVFVFSCFSKLLG